MNPKLARRLRDEGALGIARKFLQESKLDSFIGSSPAVARLKERVEKLRGRKESILILGESGTGKELIARALHEDSFGPFVGVNLSALPETLAESLLFGSVKGSFTGSNENKIGMFQQAGKGTLFLDELAEIEVGLQVKLLRVLQEREYYPVGSTILEKLECRIISATNNTTLKGLRLDLIERLGTFRIHIPPLRERLEDIKEIAESFLEEELPEELIDKLKNYNWPGNVRELQNKLLNWKTFGEL